MSRSKSLGLYVHIPFCKSRCSYCDFVSYTDFSHVESYFNCLNKEIEMWSKLLGKKRIDTVYIGGGTPSDVPIEYISKLLKNVEKTFHLVDPEITVEINPNFSRFADLKNLGINRLSIGLQAADDTVLKAVRRRHSVYDFQKAYESASVYFDNVNVDFIIGLPQESHQTITRDFELVERYRPKHVSVYILEIHTENAVVSQVDQDNTAIRHEIFVNELERLGYERYEISNFSLPGYRCKHNLKYWYNDDYLGIGVSAGGHVKSKRYVNVSNLHRYIEMINGGRFAFEYFHENSSFEELRETLFMALRLCDGVEIRRLKKLSPKINVYRLIEMFPGQLIFDRNRLKMSKSGMDFSCTLLSEIIDTDTLLRVTGGE
ncbi:MAG TPA: radical SAM family heme chaperone HemW [Pseudothermotoga sp.]